MSIREFQRGLRDIAPISVGVIPSGLIFGAVAAKTGIGLGLAVMMSVVVNAGTAQFIGLGMLSTGTAPALIVLATVLVNFRLVFYSAALAEHVRGLPLAWRLLLAYGMTDPVYLLAIKRYATADGAVGKEWYFLGTALLVFVTWMTSTVLGFVFGVRLAGIQAIGLDFAITASYIGLLVGRITNLRVALVCAVAAVLSIACVHLAYQFGLLVATVAAVIVGAALERGTSPRRAAGTTG